MPSYIEKVTLQAGFIIGHMTSIVVFGNPPELAESLASDFAGTNLTVLQSVGVLADVALAVHRHRPIVLVCHVVLADETFFNLTRQLQHSASCAVLVLTDSLDANAIAASAAAGVHAYVADGYSAHRLVALVQLAQARFKHQAALVQALVDANNLLDERKVVDHAKSILMRARQLSDDDAFRLLRSASMHTNQRLAEVSGHIIHAARFADGVNRAGQLRMLSQQLVKLQAMQLLRPDQAPPAALKDAFQRTDENLRVLSQNFAQPELVALVKQAGLTWDKLKRKLKRQPPEQDMGVVDGLAEALLAQSEDLTSQLENAGAAPPLQVLNLAGRQRMLSQRFAKFALLEALGKADVALAMLETRQSFEKAQHYLNNIPLSTPEIGRLLATAKLDWKRLLAGAEQSSLAAGQAEVKSASDALLSVFEQLSATYESSMQMLMG
jgi:AmiR/NasT family two-component response regulator